MSLIEEWFYALMKELRNHKVKVVLAFSIITIGCVIGGLLWPKKFEASALIYADDQNIIKPLLSGSAEITKPDAQQSAVVRDLITSNGIIVPVLQRAGLAKENSSASELQKLLDDVRSKLTVNDLGRGHLRVSYRSSDPQKSFDVITGVVSAFVSDAAKTKREESREAFTFIDNQVKTYKTQLQASEEKLKNFKGEGGVLSGDSSARISQLRSQISSLTLDLQVARARRDELRRQISQEKQFVSRQYKSDAFRQRLGQAQAQLDTLRLSYSDSYPDIISLKQQIEDLQKAVVETDKEQVTERDGVEGFSPAYSKMRSELSDAEVGVKTLELKLAASNRLFEDEQGYSKRGAEYEAQLAELTRDYTVTKQMYENMLERKERARLSVALDVEGQGVSYKIKEPPVFPKIPIGIRFLHFFLIAPVLGLAIPIAGLAVYIQLDPRLRFQDALKQSLPENIPVLTVIPHLSSLSARRNQRAEWGVMLIFVCAVLLIYLAIGFVRVMGIL